MSIIRPLKGVDLELADNLRSSFEQQYPKFEIIFSVASADDPAVPIVEQLMKEYKSVGSRLIIGTLQKRWMRNNMYILITPTKKGDQPVGINPKVNNIVTSYKTAKYDILWVLDSNVHVDSNTLGRSVDQLLEPGIGLVHHLPVAMQPASYAAELEHLFLDTNHAKMYLAINQVAVASCIMGKSNLYRRSDLDRVGGLAAFAQYMAEDNIIGEALWHQGLRHRMSADTACQMLGDISPMEYCRRRARWVRLRKYIVTAATLTEPFTESIVCGLMGATGAHILFGWPVARFFALHWLLWFINDYFIYKTLVSSASYSKRRGRPHSRLDLWRFIRAWLSREILALPLYLYAMFGTEITWRGQKYRCLRDGTAAAISKDLSPDAACEYTQVPVAVSPNDKDKAH